jgi:hypothetical protein
MRGATWQGRSSGRSGSDRRAAPQPAATHDRWLRASSTLGVGTREMGGCQVGPWPQSRAVAVKFDLKSNSTRFQN